MAEKKKILYIVEAMGGGVFTYIVDGQKSGGQHSCAVGRSAESYQTDQGQNYRPGSYENRGTEESCEVWL